MSRRRAFREIVEPALLAPAGSEVVEAAQLPLGDM